MSSVNIDLLKKHKKVDNTAENIIVWGFVVAIIIALVLGVLFLSALVTMWAWNLVMPYLFHLPTINIWIAFGINVLLGLIKPAVSFTNKK